MTVVALALERSKRLGLFAMGIAALAASAQAANLVGLSTNNEIVLFNSSNTSSASTRPITGLMTGESLLGIDFRPATGALYGISSMSRLYTINTMSGAAMFASTVSIPVSGTVFGVDFNPVPDRLRVVSDQAQNLRINVDNGMAMADTPLAYAMGDVNAGTMPMITASGYTNSFAGATTTFLYGIDAGLNTLVLQNPPNMGTLNTIGSLGISASGLSGFDIAAFNDTAFAAFTLGGSSTLYGINLATGNATSLGVVGDGSIQLQGLSSNPVPEPGSLVLLGSGLAGLVAYGRRRRK